MKLSLVLHAYPFYDKKLEKSKSLQPTIFSYIDNGLLL